MTTDPLTTSTGQMFDLIERAHHGAHSCEEQWWNPNAGKRERCPTMVATTVLRGIVAGLLIQVHSAAHDPDTVAHVAAGMLSQTPLEELAPEAREGWLYLARLAIESLAERLGPEYPEQTAAQLGSTTRQEATP